MKIIPAIGLYNEKVECFYQGDVDNVVAENADPVAAAHSFETKGADFLHLIDIEGAKDGLTRNYEIVRNIVNNTDLFVQVGGGIRSMAVVDAYLSAGVGRVILGTLALRNEDFAREAIEKYGERVAVSVDIKGGKMTTRGWTETSDTDYIDFCRKMCGFGAGTIICTNADRDCTMKGTDVSIYKKLADSVNCHIIACGGISSTEDILALKGAGIYGCIIGTAFFKGRLDLAEAISIAK